MICSLEMPAIFFFKVLLSRIWLSGILKTSRLSATYLAYVETTHVLTKIKTCKIITFCACCEQIPSRERHESCSLEKGIGCISHFIGQRWEIGVEGNILKVRNGSGQMHMLQFKTKRFPDVLLYDLGFKKCLWWKREDRKSISSGVFFGGQEVGVEKKDK